MNYLQAFAKDEKHIRQLIRALGNDECSNECPAFSYCKKHKMKDDCSDAYEDCADAFTHWAMREKPVRKKPLDDRPKNARGK